MDDQNWKLPLNKSHRQKRHFRASCPTKVLQTLDRLGCSRRQGSLLESALCHWHHTEATAVLFAVALNELALLAAVSSATFKPISQWSPASVAETSNP